MKLTADRSVARQFVARIDTMLRAVKSQTVAMGRVMNGSLATLAVVRRLIAILTPHAVIDTACFLLPEICWTSSCRNR